MVKTKRKKKNYCHHCYLNELSDDKRQGQVIIDELDLIFGKIRNLVKINNGFVFKDHQFNTLEFYQTSIKQELDKLK